MGYQAYQIPPAGNQSDGSVAPLDDSAREGPSESVLTLDRLRNLGLIAILLGALMLLLAVWR